MVTKLINSNDSNKMKSYEYIIKFWDLDNFEMGLAVILFKLVNNDDKKEIYEKLISGEYMVFEYIQKKDSILKIIGEEASDEIAKELEQEEKIRVEKIGTKKAKEKQRLIEEEKEKERLIREKEKQRLIEEKEKQRLLIEEREYLIKNNFNNTVSKYKNEYKKNNITIKIFDDSIFELIHGLNKNVILIKKELDSSFENKTILSLKNLQSLYNQKIGEIKKQEKN